MGALISFLHLKQGFGKWCFDTEDWPKAAQSIRGWAETKEPTSWPLLFPGLEGRLQLGGQRGCRQDVPALLLPLLQGARSAGTFFLISKGVKWGWGGRLTFPGAAGAVGNRAFSPAHTS